MAPRAQFIKTNITPPNRIHSTTANIITTISNIVTSAIDETMNSGMNNEIMNNVTERNNERMSSTMDSLPITESNFNTMLNNSMASFNESRNKGDDSFTQMFNTSFEKVTTTLSSIEIGSMQTPMGQYEEHSDYNYILFIILGIVLGVLIIIGAILGVIYNHYKKSGFHEIPGANKENCEYDPQSMVQIEQQIQQASSEDALIDKK